MPLLMANSDSGEPSLTLSLFMLRIRTDDHHPTSTADNAALFTHFSNRGSDFHVPNRYITAQICHPSKDLGKYQTSGENPVRAFDNLPAKLPI